MSGAKRVALTSFAIVTISFTSSCITAQNDEPVNQEELKGLLAKVICYPEYTCEELSVRFEVEYLPIVEYPDEIGLSYEEHWIPTEDGQTLRLWYLPAQLDRGTVIVSMGSVGNVACYLFVSRLLINNGWSVVMYDFRGFGESTGEPDLFTLHTDLDAVLDWTIINTSHSQATLLGISLGAIPSVSIAAERPESVNGVVLDCPVALGAEIERFENLLGDRTQEILAQLPPHMVSEEMIKGVRDPLLVFRSMNDTVTPPETVQLLYDNASGVKEMATFPTLEHAEGPYHDTGAYTYYLEDFLSRVWDQYTPLTVEYVDNDGD